MTIKFNPLDIQRTDILIESGSFDGSFMLNMSDKYLKLHTIELIEDLYRITSNRLRDYEHITCHLGHSPVVLSKILETIDEPVTFWLDAHYLGREQLNDTKKPLLDELGVIGQHHIKSHMIMVDDVRCFWNYGTTKEEVELILLNINPDYTISYCNGYIENDVLVAYIP